MTSVAHSSSSQNYDRIGADEFAMARMADIEGDAGGPSVDITAVQKMTSAMSGSLLTSLLVTPLDVVRVRLQSQKLPTPTVDFSKLALTTSTLTPAQTAELGVTACCREVFFAGNGAEYCLAAPRMEGLAPSPATSASPADCAVQEVQKKTYNSTFDGLRKIARNEGVATLWRGLSPTLVMAVPANIIYFTGYDWLRYNSTSPFSRLSSDYAPLTAGSVARMLAATAVGPIELVRTRMQAASGTSTTNHLMETFKGIREMVGVHGYTSLWRGLTLTLWRDVPFSGLYWWGYESIRAKLTDIREEHRGHSLSQSDFRQQARLRSQSEENHTETFLDSFTAGALSGTFASIVTTPFDVGKTRTQVYHDAAGGSVPGGQAAPEQRNMVRLLWHIFKTEGVPGLWRGWIPRTLKVAPACAIMISSYEVGKRVFRGVNERAGRKHEAP
ncbi:Mitochondrial carrier protein MTM1 [Tolypocladium ophioglossoides CBS 100239]|uniref:Mitochondrial carrier protein MTM1 n=1 Tax=Tolypocladium ophioglossoides (strain CBS 100239) TaxID=1163406 RepID=A0A0L0NA43_TOLOC|nr:Mitochondrial carrier protein MTM1 [Tolypocladium ophioglossoides CBS 100239]